MVLARRLGRFLALLALSMMLTGLPASAQTGDQTDTIRGTVVNTVTHAPIPRALVTSSDQRLATLTDSEGRFAFTLPRSNDSDNNGGGFGSVFLFARKPGYLAENTSLGASAHSRGDELTLNLVPEAVITGKVSLPNSEAPDSITVELFRRQVQDGRAHWFPAGGTQSRSDGEFRFADLPAGTYKVLTRELLDRDPLTFDPQGQLYGYPPVYSQNAPDFASASTIPLSAGMTAVANLAVARKPYYRVHIPVANAQPDTGLNVIVSVSGHKGPGFALGYNNRDQAIEGLLPDGSYTVEAFGFGPGAGNGAVAITVSGAAVRGPSLTLIPNAPVRVDVTEEFTSQDTSGSITFNLGPRSVKLKGPRRYLNVALEPDDDSERGNYSLRNPTGPGDEALIIENARPGRYWVRVTSQRGYAASVRSGNVDLQREPLVISPGASPSPIEITMRDDTAEISGTVEGITAPANSLPAATTATASFDRLEVRPPAPAHVYCIPLPDSGGQYAEVWVSPDGTFVSPALAPGAYRVLAFERPQTELEFRNPEAMQAYESSGPVVRVAGGQKERVRLRLVSSSE